MKFTTLPPDEIERRRALSVAALKEKDASDWDARYQEICDGMYWRFGPCCAGCDHWNSYAGLTGECRAGPIIPGADVMRSLGFSFWSYTPEPGYPYTEAKHKCGLFSDGFDWSTLDADYLRRIGAMVGNTIKPLPK